MNHIKRDLGTNSFVLVFGANSNVQEVVAALHESITEKVNGVPRYGYESLGLFSNSFDSRYLMDAKHFDGSPKKVCLSFANTLQGFCLEVGTDWSDTLNCLNNGAQAELVQNYNRFAILVPKYQFSVFVFAAKDWLILVPIRKDFKPFYSDVMSIGGVGVVNTSRNFSEAPKSILFSISALTRTAFEYNYMGYGAYHSPSFLYPRPNNFIQDPSFHYSNNLLSLLYTPNKTMAFTHFGFGYGTEEKKLLEMFPPKNSRAVAATLRGVTDYTNFSNKEFSFCGLKAGAPDKSYFMDKVRIKCDSDFFIDENGSLTDHYVIEGRCRIGDSTVASPTFKYLIPC